MAATIAWDSWGVAHINGTDEESVFRALGWAQCASHLEELVAQWRAVRDDALFGHLEAGRRGFAASTPQQQRRHAAVVEGVRRWLAAHPGEAPADLPELEDSLPLGTIRSQTWPWCIMDALTGALGAPGAPDDRGSNWWAVSGDRTADGVPYLLSDPHLPVGGLTHPLPPGAPPRPVPGLEVLEVSLRCPGLDVTGFVSVGTSLPVLGHNRHLAWGFTTGGPRTSGLSDGAFSTTYDEGVERMDAATWLLATATSVQEVVDNWDAGGMFPQNVLVADTSGDSWYVRTGRVLVGGREATRDELVQLRGMPDGWVQSCNSGPDLTAQGVDLCSGRPADVVNDRPDRPTARAKRLHDLLPRVRNASHDDLVALATDDVWWDTPLWTALVEQVAPGDPLARFDGHARGDSEDALRWLRFREAMAARSTAESYRRVLEGTTTTEDLELVRECLPPVTGQVLSDVVRFGRAGDQPGTNAALVSFVPDLLDRESTSLAIQAPLRVMGFVPGAETRAPVSGGCFARLTRLEPGNVRSWSVVLPGLASRPGHPHRDDQWGLVRERALRPVAATWDEALAEAVEVEEL